MGLDQPQPPTVTAMPEPHKRAYRHPNYKTAYRVSNWPEYDKVLCDRGDITLWISRLKDRGSQGPVDLIVDSTGLKVCGQGEWHSHKHGGKKGRCWKKLNIGVDDQGHHLAGSCQGINDSRSPLFLTFSMAFIPSPSIAYLCSLPRPGSRSGGVGQTAPATLMDLGSG